MAIDNVLAVFLPPIVGTWSDKVDTRLGKRTPFIVIGTIAAVILMMIMPVADRNSQLGLFMISLAFTLIAMALYRSPAVALMPDLTPKPLRSSANAVINLMGAVGSIYTLILIQLLVKKEDNPSYMPVFVGVALIMIVSIIILVITIREKKLAAQMRLEGPEIEGIEETESELKNVTEKETQRVETRQIAGTQQTK